MKQTITSMTGKFSQEAMEKAFAKVENPNDWKDKIDAVVPLNELIVTVDAIMHFTATPVDIIALDNGIRVMSVGYRMGPAGP